ncbi:tetratricopeptide repeat protein [Jeongeupia wiesaeckerbachi]|uniref:tetratricopeptide repeat protein n=1 Tax=Jeongeupia wiesaeckerbachi TaxID=3051218 RepID=UPI003D806110
MHPGELNALAHLISESERLTYLDPHAALSLAESASRLAPACKDTLLAISAWRCYGTMLFAFGRIPDGQHAMFKALTLADAEDLVAERGELIQELACAYYTQGDYDEAIAYWADCIDTDGFTLSTRIHAYIGLGQVYYAHERYEMALQNHLDAKALILPPFDTDLHSRVLINLAADYAKLGRFDDVALELDEAMPLAEAAGNPEYIGEILVYRSAVALARGQIADAHTFLDQAVAMRRVWAWGEISQNLARGRVYLFEGRLDEALTAVHTALLRADEMGTCHKTFQAHHLLAQIYQRKGNTNQAEYFHRRYQEAFSRIVRSGTYAKLQALEARLNH